MEDLTVSERLTIPGSELRVSFARSGGPGGQNVNKVESKVELRWAPGDSVALSEDDKEWVLGRLVGQLTAAGDLLVTSSRSRDQARNREDARAKLAGMIREALQRPKRRRATRPSAGSVTRRIEEKKRLGRAKKERRPPETET